MAGMYNLFNGEDRFVILTTEANESMRPVHDRMPLILREDEITDWLREDDRTQDFLRIVPPQLMREQSYEQMSLFDMEFPEKENRKTAMSKVPNLEKLEKLDKAMDSIKKRFGDGAIVRGSSLIRDKKPPSAQEE
jgi:hypothetical protein